MIFTDHIMKDDGIVDTDHDVTVGDTDLDVTVGYSDCDVTVSDNEPADVPKCDPMNLFARNRPDPVFTDDDEYQIERTPGVIDPKWRIKCHSYPINNRGFGQHDAVLQQMTHGDEHDKHLMQVLSHVVSQSTAVSSVQNDDDEYVEEEDYEEESYSESGCSYEVITGNGEGTNEDKSNSNGDGDGDDSEEGNATSAYESANENLSDKGCPQKCDETLQETEYDVNRQTPRKPWWLLTLFNVSFTVLSSFKESVCISAVNVSLLKLNKNISGIMLLRDIFAKRTIKVNTINLETSK